MIRLNILSKRLCLRHEGLPDALVVSFIKTECGFEVNFLSRYIKSSKSISNQKINAIFEALVSFDFS